MSSVIHDQTEEVYLQPGELFIAHVPTVIRTILGSCVGASFWDFRTGIGALFHAQLPVCPLLEVGSADPKKRHHYVDSSIREIARRLDDLGLGRSTVEVKVFGGGDVLCGFDATDGRPTIGRLNCESAMKVLKAEGFTVAASSLGGTLGLKIAFDTGSGDVLVRRLA